MDSFPDEAITVDAMDSIAEDTEQQDEDMPTSMMASKSPTIHPSRSNGEAKVLTQEMEAEIPNADQKRVPCKTAAHGDDMPKEDHKQSETGTGVQVEESKTLDEEPEPVQATG